MPAGLSQMIQSNFSLQLGDDAGDAFVGQRVLVPRLRGRQHGEVRDALVADQRLRQLGVALHDIDEIVDDAALGAHDEIEVAQPDVEVDEHDLLSALGESDAQCRRRRRLADAALARCDDQYLGHARDLLFNPER